MYRCNYSLDGRGISDGSLRKCVHCLLNLASHPMTHLCCYSQVVFGTKGALAGILGTAAVAVDVHGFTIGDGSVVELDGLPFRGSVRVGKKSNLFPDDAQPWT